MGFAFRSRIWLGLAGIPLAFVLGAPVALGSFGSPGSGHATAALGTLTAPIALTARFAEARFSGVGAWRTGTSFYFPASVYVTLRR
jgi:hypothetical protein